MSTFKMRNVLLQLFGWLAVLFSGSFLLLSGGIFSAWSVYKAAADNAKIGDWGAAVGVAIGHSPFLVATFYLAIAFARYLLRVDPPRIGARLRIRSLLLGLLITAIFVVIVIFFLAAYIVGSEKHMSHRLPRAVLVCLITLLIWFIGFMVPLLQRHLNPYSFARHDFVLFLRRFSSFSDRAVMNIMLRKGRKKPIVFLVPSHKFVGDWNPFLVGFVGMRLLHPFRSVPYFFRVDEGWEAAVQTLVTKAQIVILDVSEASDAIMTEVDIIERSESWHKTTLLRDANAKSGYELGPRLRRQSIITYRRSWIRALPRLLMGLLFICIAWAMPLIIILAFVPVTTLMVKVTIGMFLAALYLALYLLFFVRKSIDRGSKQALKYLLRPKRNMKEALLEFRVEYSIQIRLVVASIGGILLPIALILIMNIVLEVVEPRLPTIAGLCVLLVGWPLYLGDWLFPQLPSCANCGFRLAAKVSAVITYFLVYSAFTYGIETLIINWWSRRRLKSSVTTPTTSSTINS